MFQGLARRAARSSTCDYPAAKVVVGQEKRGEGGREMSQLYNYTLSPTSNKYRHRSSSAAGKKAKRRKRVYCNIGDRAGPGPGTRYGSASLSIYLSLLTTKKMENNQLLYFVAC